MEEMPLRCNNSGKGAIALMTKEVIHMNGTYDITPVVLTLLGHSLGQVRTLILQNKYSTCLHRPAHLPSDASVVSCGHPHPA